MENRRRGRGSKGRISIYHGPPYTGCKCCSLGSSRYVHLPSTIPGTIANPNTGDVLASAGDDGNVIVWVLDSQTPKTNFGDDGIEDKESWRTRHMCRSTGAEIYDLAWSPDGVYFITGSMDNVARIYNAQTGMLRPSNARTQS